MRMKFNKLSQLLLVSAASLLVAGLMTACKTATTDFVYVSSSLAAGPNSYGEIDVFEINVVSGFLRPIPTSPFPSGGRDPVAEAVSSDYANLYVVNQDDNTIVQFLIGSDGKIYPQNTVNTPGIYPLAMAVNGSNLFVVDTYQPLPICSTADPCSGSVAVFPLLPASGKGSNEVPSGAPGTPVINPSNGAQYWPLSLPGKPNDVIVPTAVNVLQSGSYLYVTAYDSTNVIASIPGLVNICDLTSSAYSGAVGYVFGFAVGSGGVLTALPGSPFAAGSLPCGIASDSSDSHVYVTDYASAHVLGFSVASSTQTALPAGTLTELGASPFPAGNQPSAIVVDPKYPYAYVANSMDGTVGAYSINASGALNSLGTYATGIQPMAMGIDPSTNHYLFVANYLSNNVSDFSLSTTDGTLIDTAHSPYMSNAQPSAVAAIPHKTQM
jgi:6-phosphogluconolactonase (cycloisomerase 2 family)